MTDELKPCPNQHCVGCDDVIFSSNGAEQVFCECMNCGMSGPVADDIHGARSLWNALPRTPAAGEGLREALSAAERALTRTIGGLDAAAEAGLIAENTYDYVIKARDAARAALDEEGEG